MLLSWSIETADSPKTGLMLNNSRADSVGVLCVFTSIGLPRVWCIRGNFSWSADASAGLAPIGVVWNLVLFCGCAPTYDSSVKVNRGETGGEGDDFFKCSSEPEFITGHDLTRDMPSFTCLGLRCLRGIIGLIRASVGASDRVRLLVEVIRVGIGLETLRLIMRNPVGRKTKFSSRLSWDEQWEKNGESGRGSSPLTSLFDADIRRLAVKSK